MAVHHVHRVHRETRVCSKQPGQTAPSDSPIFTAGAQYVVDPQRPNHQPKWPATQSGDAPAITLSQAGFVNTKGPNGCESMRNTPQWCTSAAVLLERRPAALSERVGTATARADIRYGPGPSDAGPKVQSPVPQKTVAKIGQTETNSRYRADILGPGGTGWCMRYAPPCNNPPEHPTASESGSGWEMCESRTLDDLLLDSIWDSNWIVPGCTFTLKR